MFSVRKIRLNSGGYDKYGNYWGSGQNLYEWEGDHGEDTFSGQFRARDREDALKKAKDKFEEEIATSARIKNWIARKKEEEENRYIRNW